MEHLYLVFLVIGVAFLFDFINGFHDAANSIATIVATKVLTPLQALLWASFFNFIAFLFIDLHVAETIANGLVNNDANGTLNILAALSGAILFNLTTWYFGLPSSSSHALIGGMLGASVMSSGLSALKWNGLIKFGISIVLSPLLGIMMAMLLMKLVQRLFRLSKQDSMSYRYSSAIQLISSALLSLSHGANDAQKTMGIIAILLFSNQLIGPVFYVPFWVVISCNLVMALGTLAGGWRIINTMAYKITHLSPIKGACVETASAATLFGATLFGIPVSTTHTVTGAVFGAGWVEGIQRTNWEILWKILWAWLFTLPVSALIAAFIVLVDESVLHLHVV